jgi:hypothetical protein
MKSVAEKLLIRPEATVWLSDPSKARLIEPLPDGATMRSDPAGASAAIVFADDAATLRGVVARHVADLVQASFLWVLYPKGNRADLNRDSLWPILAEHGLRPITQVAVDEIWSALRFRPLRPDEPKFKGGR